MMENNPGRLAKLEASLSADSNVSIAHKLDVGAYAPEKEPYVKAYLAKAKAKAKAKAAKKPSKKAAKS